MDLFTKPETVELKLSNPEQYTPDVLDDMRDLYTFLYRHKYDYSPASELRSILLFSPRYTRILVHNLRSEGYPIIANNDGYKYATEKSEIDHCIARLFSSVRNTAEAARGLMEARSKFFEGQLAFDIDTIQAFYDNITEGIKQIETER